MARWLVATISALVLGMSSSATAATFTVSGFGDPAGATCAGTTCASLRAAVTAADQAQNTGSTISLGSGTYTLGGSGSAGGPLSIALDMTISGASESSTTIQQTGSGDGVLRIAAPTANVAISDLTITGGNSVGVSPGQAIPPEPGTAGGDAVGGILDAGALTLDAVSVSGNRATGGTGGATTNPAAPGGGGDAVGGIDVSGTLTMHDSSVSSNTAAGGSGGVASGDSDGAAGGSAVGAVAVEPGAGAVSIVGSNLSNNVSTGGAGGASAGAISNHDGAGGAAYGALADLGAQPVAIGDSTVDGNRVTGGIGGSGPQYAPAGGAGGSAAGGGVYDAGGALTVSDSAIDGNIATGGAGGSGAFTSGAAGGARGGGLAVISPGTVDLERATIGMDTVTGGAAGQTQATSTGTASSGADAQGGGAYLAATSSLINVTLAENVATGSPGGVANATITVGAPGRGIGGGMSVQPSSDVQEHVTLASDTLFANAVEAPSGGTTFGGDLDDGSVPTTVADTIFSAGIGDAATGTCAIFGGNFTDAGHNLESTAPSQCRLGLPGDLVGSDPQLGQLADHGGPGPTLAPGVASPARGAGGGCTDPSLPGMPPLMTDERGAPRHAQCDIGAYETQPPSVVSAPALLGPATVGAPLVCPTSGFAGDSPLSFAFAWLQGGTAIPAATSASYTPSPADLGKTVSCSVVATNAYGSAAATSNALTVQSAGVFAGILLRSKKLTADGHGHVSMSLFCPASTPGGRCSVEVSLYAKTGVLPTSATGVPKKAKGPREAALLARAGLSVAAGHAKSARLKLTEAGRRVTSHLPVQVRVLLTSRDTAGDMVSRSARATVLRARRGHAHH